MTSQVLLFQLKNAVLDEDFNTDFDNPQDSSVLF